MRTIFYIVMAASLATQLHGRLTPDRPEAKPNQELTTMETINRTTFDFFFERLGIQALSENNELFIHNIINELNMNDYCIEIRKMSNFAQQMFGRTNAFVLPSPFFKRSHAYLYISEEWFDTLSAESKEALVKHELMHIKNNHAGKKLLVWVILSSSLLYLTNKVTDKMMNLSDQDSTDYKLFIEFSPVILWISYFALNSAYSRITEKDADIKAAETIADKVGFVDLFKDIKAETENPKSKFLIKRLLGLTLKPFEYIHDILFATHPHLDDRIEYIQDLA